MFLRLFFSRCLVKLHPWMSLKGERVFFLNISNSLFFKSYWTFSDLRLFAFWFSTKYIKSFQVHSVRLLSSKLRFLRIYSSSFWFFFDLVIFA